MSSARLDFENPARREDLSRRCGLAGLELAESIRLADHPGCRTVGAAEHPAPIPDSGERAVHPPRAGRLSPNADSKRTR